MADYDSERQASIRAMLIASTNITTGLGRVESYLDTLIDVSDDCFAVLAIGGLHMAKHNLIQMHRIALELATSPEKEGGA